MGLTPEEAPSCGVQSAYFKVVLRTHNSMSLYPEEAPSYFHQIHCCQAYVRGTGFLNENRVATTFPIFC